MTRAAVIDNPTAGIPPASAASRIARVDVLHDLGEAEPIWRAFETAGQSWTPYQRFDFQAAWQRHIGEREHLRPFIVVARDAAGRPLLILPLVVKQENGARVATFLGGKHVTFNMPLMQRDFAETVGKADMDALLKGIQSHRETIDILALTRQPQRWLGLVNPLSLLPNQASTNGCPLLLLKPGAMPAERISNSFRRALKNKERKLQALPGYRYLLASTEADIKRLLDAFFVLKPLRMAAQNLPNVFADPGVEDFIRQTCLAPVTGGGHAMVIHALECDDEVIALSAGVADGNRFSVMFGTYTMSGAAKHSPGLILLREMIDHYAARGYAAFDLGVGTDEYKQQFCKSDDPIFDSFIPLTTRGKLAAMGLSSFAHAKRLVKQTPALMHMAQMLRNAFQH